MFIAKCAVRIGKKTYAPGDEIDAKALAKVKEELLKADAIKEIGNKADAPVDENDNPEQT